MDLVGNDHIDQLVAHAMTGNDTVGQHPLNSLKVDLFQEDLTPSRDDVLATYTAAVADYGGYAQGTVTWNEPSRADDGAIEVVGVLDEFRPTGSSTPNVVYGFYSTLGDGSLGFTGRFDDAPLPMGDALDAIVLTLRYRPSEGGTASVVS